MTKPLLGLTAVLALAAVAGIAFQARALRALQAELATLREQGRDLAALREENTRLAKTIAEAADLRRDTGALEQVSVEAEAVRARLAALVRAQAAQADEQAKVGVLDGRPVYDVAHLDLKPQARSQSRPTYPEALRTRGVTGETTLEFVVDFNGAARNARVVNATHPEFEATALATVQRMKFQPGARNGEVVNARTQMTIRFSPPRNDQATTQKK